MDSTRIPVTVLTGFLGAGKTTALNRLLADPAFGDTAVIINEAGAVGIDHLIVERTGEDVVLLQSGCLCCSVRGELVEALARLAEARMTGTVPPFRRLVIETSGLADPGPVLQTLVRDRRVAGAFRLDGVVAVVDAVTGKSSLERHAESVRQAAMADRLVLSKTDLATPAMAEAVRRALQDINPVAPILEAAATPPARLFAPILAQERGGSGFAADWLGPDPAAASPHCGSIRCVSVTLADPVPFGRLESVLDLLAARHGPALLRLKAIVALAEDPGRPLLVHAVQHLVHPLARLERWPGEDRRSRLVVFVAGEGAEEVADLLASLGGEPRIDRPDAAALVDNPLALR